MCSAQQERMSSAAFRAGESVGRDRNGKNLKKTLISGRNSFLPGIATKLTRLRRLGHTCIDGSQAVGQAADHA